MPQWLLVFCAGPNSNSKGFKRFSRAVGGNKVIVLLWQSLVFSVGLYLNSKVVFKHRGPGRRGGIDLWCSTVEVSSVS